MSSRSTARNSIRIIGGELRSRRIEFIDHKGLRPTGDRVRETLFNWLQNPIVGARCLDLYAGSGVLGIEALSRGARSVDLVEADRRVAQTISANLEKLELENVTVINTTAENWLRQQTGAGECYDVAFLDPPFAEASLLDICVALDASGVMSTNALVYLESDQPVVDELLPGGWECIKSKKAGQVYFYLYRLP